jgi:NACalpha-BTF3-like transcription factor
MERRIVLIHKEVKYGETTKMKTEAQTSTPTKKRMGAQEEEIRKKMKYHKNPPTITITEDDVELVADKVQDRGEDVVRATEAQREEIMEKLVEVHDILQRLQLNTTHHPTTQQTEKNRKHQCRRSRKRP